MTSETKACTKCGETKATTEFHKRARTNNSLRSQCKACDKADSDKYRVGNPDRARAVFMQERGFLL